MENIADLWLSTGLAQMSFGQGTMIIVSLGLLYLAIVKRFEPLLLVPIGFGGLLANIPGVDIATGTGVLAQFYDLGIGTGIFPLVIFMGVGAMTDFVRCLQIPKLYSLERPRNSVFLLPCLEHWGFPLWAYSIFLFLKPQP